MNAAAYNPPPPRPPSSVAPPRRPRWPAGRGARAPLPRPAGPPAGAPQIDIGQLLDAYRAVQQKHRAKDDGKRREARVGDGAEAGTAAGETASAGPPTAVGEMVTSAGEAAEDESGGDQGISLAALWQQLAAGSRAATGGVSSVEDNE